ncbi:MAG: TaqI-like C-terminal specificity domain-containing protein, partial [Candidatus Hodarchaeota archaeon]
LVILVFQKLQSKFEAFKNDNNQIKRIGDNIVEINILSDQTDLQNLSSPQYILQKQWTDSPRVLFNIYSNEATENLLKKIRHNSIPLEKICDFCLGLTPYDRYAGQTSEQIKNRVFHAQIPKDESYRRWIVGGDVGRYTLGWKKKEWINYGPHLAAPREKRFFVSPRILVRQIISGNQPRIYATYTEEELYNGQTIFNLLKKDNTTFGLKYILGILNSKLMTFYHANVFLDKSKRLFQKILIQDAKLFPIVQPNSTLETELISLVDELISLKNSKDLTIELTQQILALDSKIDQIVYRIYNLMPEEQEIIERDFK